EDTHRFSYCAASASYQDGTYFFVSVDENYSWSLGFSNEQWRLSQGAATPIWYRFDGGLWFKATGDARNGNFFTVSMPPDGTLIDLFRRGHQMELRFSEGAYNFLLDGTFRLTAALATCVTQSKGEADQRTTAVQPEGVSPPVHVDSRNTE